MSLKLDHIPTLEGLLNYPPWERAVIRTLKGEALWPYVSDNNNPASPWRRIVCPQLAANPTPAQRRAFSEWWQQDSKAKDIIERRVSPVVASIIPNNDLTTSHDVWIALKTRFGRIDVTAQFDLRNRIHDIKLQDHANLDAYIGEFKTARAQFLNMGVAFSEDEIVHLMIRGLPSDHVWSSVKAILTQIVQDHADAVAIAAVPLAPDTLLNRIVSRITTECIRLSSEAPILLPVPTPAPSPDVAPGPVYGPGSEYVNYVAIRKHAKNPNGIICTICRSASHDRDYCFSKGGGCEGQQPKKLKDNEMVAFMRDLSC